MRRILYSSIESYEERVPPPPWEKSKGGPLSQPRLPLDGYKVDSGKGEALIFNVGSLKACGGLEGGGGEEREGGEEEEICL
jgi:hypothetical protein